MLESIRRKWLWIAVLVPCLALFSLWVASGGKEPVELLDDSFPDPNAALDDLRPIVGRTKNIPEHSTQQHPTAGKRQRQ